jgi:Periplasmic component of the Tol biopolymer transport system
MSRPDKSRLRSVGDPFGTLPVSSWIAPVLSGLGLIVVFLVTISLLGVNLSFGAGGTGGGAGNGGIGGGTTARTPAPSNVVLPEPQAAFPGSIVYVKAGNIWIQTGGAVRQLTDGGTDSMPSWSPDGKTVYFIRTTQAPGLWPANGRNTHYLMTVPDLMSISADGTGAAERLRTGAFRKKGLTWFYWMRQPVMSPNGKTFALVSDGPDPTKSDVILQFWDPAKNKTTIPPVSEVPPLGHQDPAWRPDGNMLFYVRNDRDGAKGTPVIYRWDVIKKTSAPVTGPGYLEPSFSPDGKYIAATRIDAFGSDVVILDAASGRELLRVTHDDGSWAPAWSPAGDAIAFFHIDGQIVDLWMASLDGPAPTWTIKETKALTTVSGLDGSSRPSWFVPADQLPATPAPSLPSSSAGPSSSAPSSSGASSAAPSSAAP